MKKVIILILTVVLLVSLCACGKSENAKVCEDLISKIGEVTLDSDQAIKVAEEAYDALSDEEKGQIEKSAEKLTASRETYNQLLIDEKLGDVADMIDAIGDVTLDSEKAIISAEDAFDALSDEEKEIIKESGEKLEASRAAYDTMVMEQHASAVIDSIDAIGDVTLDAKSAIEESRRATGNVFLDNYVLDFLDVPETVSERDLQKSIIRNLKDFILEIGKDFTFIGEEYRVQVGKHDYYIDLLFYHRGLSCLVAFELKIGEFKPEYVGKINLYLEALDREVKKDNENPSVGVILCASKDDEVVEFALSRSLSPTMVSEYNLKLIDKKLLQKKLKEYIELAGKVSEEE